MSLQGALVRSLVRRAFGVVMSDDRRSYRGIEMLAGALHLADAIERAGSQRAVGVLLPTSGLFPMASLAAWTLGRVLVPLNYLLAREELEYVIADSGCDCIITVSPMLDFLGYEPAGARLIRMDALAFRGCPTPRWPAPARGDDLGVLLYTSGTSGRPKGVMLSHHNILTNIRQTCTVASFTQRDLLLGVLPQFHSFGFTVLTMLPLIRGIRAHMLARFQPTQVLAAIREHHPTAFVGIPSMYGALLRLKDATREDFSCFRYMISGGEPLPLDIAHRFEERFGQVIHEGYGLTETSPVTNVNRPGRARLGTVGPPVPDLEQIVCDPETGRPLAIGAEGEVRMRGPNVFRGYYGLAEETTQAFDERGFFRTGDMGRIDPDGSLRITGRIKEMLIVGGENVFPREIEEVLNRHPSVAASGVVGQMDPVRGEVPVAFVELEEGYELDERALREHCRASLAGYKVPRRIIALAELPRNPTGKIMRRALRDDLERFMAMGVPSERESARPA